ncbi:MAG TPA: ATP-binding protein [Candidatus Limnocylindrales bacterium]|nr:ATP-binding protein [Candidatus Limnocylindrales bacterium]
MPVSARLLALHAAATIEPTKPGPAVGDDVGPSSRRSVPDHNVARPMGPIVVIVGGAILSAIFIAFATLDVLDLAGLWELAHWTVSIGAALIATSVAWRAASGHERQIRAWVLIAVGVWAVGRVLAVLDGPLGLMASPSPADLVMVATVVPGIGWLIASVDPRLGRTARTAALLDITAIIVALAGIVVVTFGRTAEEIGGLAGSVALAYPVTFITGAGAVSMVAFMGAGRRTIPISTLAMAAGLALFGLAGIALLADPRSSHGVVGDPVRALVSIAPLAVAAGSAFGRPAIVRVRANTADSRSFLMPIATASFAALVILYLDDRLDGIAEIGMRVAISITIVLIIVRQTMLLDDRRVAAERERVATLRAEAASADAGRIAQLLATAEERFRNLVEQVPAAVYLDRLDLDQLAISETVYVSPRVEGLTGFSPAEIAADNELWFERIHVEDREQVLTEWDRHCRARTPFSVTYRFLTKDGRTIWLAEDAAILESDGHAFSQGMILDVTDRRETEASLRQAQKMEAVGQLAGGVAHDFNNLLTVITGHAGLLRETIDVNDPTRIDVDAIATAAASSADLVGQLLAFGRRTMLRPEIVDIGTVVSDVLPMLRRLLPEHIDVVTRLDPDLPAIRADPGQVQQVVLNLAINGRDAMPAGGTLTIATEARVVSPSEASRHLGLAPGSYVRLTIADEGVGMDAATRDRIFEPFFTTKAAGRGTGLGLATVYGIVKQSGGYIAIDSAVDRGSTFSVFLPVTTEQVAVRPPSIPVRAPRGHERIVLCEDEPAVRDLVAAVLRRSGYSVVSATNPADALLLIADRQSPADLLLTDVVMPGMSGPDLARRASVLRPDLRVVLMSGYALDAADRDAVGRQAVFLAKPFSPSALARTVRDALDDVPGVDGALDLGEVAARG